MIKKDNKADQFRSWAFKEAITLQKKVVGLKKSKVVFATGYGPSGLPHIGTFAEVMRTTWVKQAFEYLMPNIQTDLLVFSDDMDGLRSIPDNIVNSDMLSNYLDYPLSSVPDPFDEFASFAQYNNNKLKSFLDSFNINYSFKSATQLYQSGYFDDYIIKILNNYEAIMKLMLENLGEERQKTYSPILPICPKTGRVLQVKLIDIQGNNITYKDPNDGEIMQVTATGGKSKLQWKADWGMRWHALSVDYEMSGKDLIASVELARKICKIIGGIPPQSFSYELFLDQDGQKISKSKGNGLTIDDWLSYASKDSLSLFIFNKPKTAKRLSLDVIPKIVDEYLQNLASFKEDNNNKDNPIWHIHNDKIDNNIISNYCSDINFSVLLNLVCACKTDDMNMLLSYVKVYDSNIDINNKLLIDMLRYAICYFNDIIKPTLLARQITSQELPAIKDLRDSLLNSTADEKIITNLLYDIGNRWQSIFPSLNDWFGAIYQILLGQKQGPRLGKFFMLYGVNNIIEILNNAIDKADEL